MGSPPELVRFVRPADYLEAEKVSCAVECAHSVATGLINHWIDPLMRLEEIQLALEVLCDAPHGDPALALWAIESVEGRFRRPELWESDNLAANAVRYACWATMMAEVAHRNGRYPAAVIYTSSGFDALEHAASDRLGGRLDRRQALARVVASSHRSSLAGAAVALDGIRTAALRRAAYDEPAKDWFRSRTELLLPAAIASGQTYPRSHSFSTQRLFEQVELQAMEHLEVLREISDATRGGSKRSWATAPLVEMEHFRALGRIDAAKQAAASAVERATAATRRCAVERVERLAGRHRDAGEDRRLALGVLARLGRAQLVDQVEEHRRGRRPRRRRRTPGRRARTSRWC